MDLLRYYQYVLAVADEGSFTDAAYELGITQPPLSQGVRRLEERWGIRLFERGPKGVSLTREGNRLLPTMRALVAEAASLDHRARHLGQVACELGFGVDPALSSVADQIAARLRQVMEPPLRPRAGLPDALVRAVRSGELDVAVVQHPCATDGVHAGPPITLATSIIVPAAVGEERTESGWSQGSRGRIPLDLPLAIRPRDEAPAAHDLLLHEALRLGHVGDVLSVPADQLRTWVTSGTAWALVPTAGRPESGTGIETFPAPPRMRLRAAVVGGSPELVEQVQQIALDLAGPDE